MTRENKLALVVGFALILLVGVLISDHFSAARSLHAAELTQTVDPLADPRHENPDLIALRSDPVPVPPPIADLAIDPAVTNPALTSSSGVRAIDPTAPEEAGLRVPAGAIDATTPRRHRVQSGESLTSICTRYYGKPNLFDRLARHNGLENANAIHVGQRLEIPPIEMLVPKRAEPAAPPRTPAEAEAAPSAAPPTPAPRAAATAPGPKTYTVRDGDSLSRIAGRRLGSMNRWPALYEANRDQLETPDDLRPGMKLKIPG
ncbi:MAG: LysM peptidoglycan-binding domain-containing protein [Planctomycetes bacterium]|nr:LysM peptidoglycan-binding domain-containing protein [Planctomycetota bacterium]